MKRQIIILGLGFILAGCSAFAVTYYNSYSPYPYRSSIHRYNVPNAYRYNRHCPYCGTNSINSYYRPNFYPRYNPYYNQINYNNVSRIKQMRRIKKMRRKLKNQLTWLSNSGSKGNLTGYSVPVNKNILNNFPMRPVTSSTTTNTELWQNGNGNSGKHYGLNSFGSYNDNRQTGAKSGVTIIYD